MISRPGWFHPKATYHQLHLSSTTTYKPQGHQETKRIVKSTLTTTNTKETHQLNHKNGPPSLLHNRHLHRLRLPLRRKVPERRRQSRRHRPQLLQTLLPQRHRRKPPNPRLRRDQPRLHQHRLRQGPLPLQANRRRSQQRRLRPLGRIRIPQRGPDPHADGSQLLRPAERHAQSPRDNARSQLAPRRPDPAGDFDRRAARRADFQHLLRQQMGG